MDVLTAPTQEAISVESKQVQQHFRAQVPAYQELMERLIPFYNTKRDMMIGLMPSDRLRPLRVLDLGCGPGLMASRILEEFPYARLTLFDLTEEMIESCQRRLGKHAGGQLITAEVVVDEMPDIRDRQYALWRAYMLSRGEDGDAWYEKHLAKDHPVTVEAWIRTLAESGVNPVGCFWRYLNFAILCGWRAMA